MSTVILLSITIHLLWKYFLEWQRFKFIAQLNRPKSFPIIGIPYLFYKIKSTKEGIKLCNSFIDSCDLPWGFRFGLNAMYVTIDPKEVQIILNHTGALKKNYIYKGFDKLSKQSLFTADVTRWKRMRKLLSPCFSQNILNTFHSTIANKSEELVKQLGNFAGQGRVNVIHIVERIFVELICETAMNVKIDKSTGIHFSQYRNVLKALDIAMLKQRLPSYYANFIYEKTKTAAEENEYIRVFMNFVSSILQEKKRSFMNQGKNVDFNLQNENVTLRREPVLDKLLNVQETENLTEEDILHEIAGFLFAGSDTTSSAIAFAMICLGMNADVQEQLYQEVKDVIGISKIVELSDLPKLKYTEMVIKETLRLFPIGAFTARETTADIDLGNRILPKGLSIILPILYLHRSPKYWENPLKFDPKRHTPEETVKRHAFTYLPFLNGPRSCIGIRYAMMAMKTMLATIVRNFKISTEYKEIEEIELELPMVLKAADGYNCTLECRQDDV